MALQQSYTSPQFGFTASEAYKHITRVDISKAGACTCQLDTFYDAAARWAEKQPLNSVSFSFNTTDMTLTGNLMADVYTYLKTLPEFTDAIDV